ncbi:MAG: bifunctional oligoribonuclease/PAP phosphatase NrnA [Ignavibacteriae bacterium]|nr:bifunctional oligoribonuclease/PAP phosphatase NrnA [Ignavibacteriota bacterium]NOG97479.1 bifunctional oligoribonuclease/PAP phosphatase NrnA [Ignavibacteriota bacterium]
MLDFSKLKEIIETNERFIITSHVNPDADAIGSELALHMLLKKLGKTSYIINHSATPYNLEFLDKENAVQKYDPAKHDKLIEESDVVFFLDINQLYRVVSLKEVLGKFDKIKVCIDHHQDPDEFADYYFTDISATSTGEIIYEFIKETKIVELDLDIANSIYAAIMTDTGSFRYERTTSKTHLIIADLLNYGVNPNYIYDRIHDQSKMSKLKLLGEALNTITLNSSKDICYMTITQQALKRSGALESDVDGFVSFCMSIENVKIGMLFFELKNGIKISFRSKGKIPVNKLAKEFSGGGHTNAAGTRLFDVQLDDYIDKVVTAAKKYL